MTKFFQLPFRSSKKAPVPVAPPPRPVFNHKMGYSLDYWRSRPDLVKWARDLYATPDFQAFYSVLAHETPLDSIDAVRGHRRALRIIELMAETPPESKPQIEATFGAERDIDLSDSQNQQQQPQQEE